jgi:hypothetical protein
MNIMEKAQRAIRASEKPEKRIPFEKRFTQLKKGGDQYTKQWTDLRDFHAPHRGSFTGDQPDRVTGFNYQKQLSGHPGRCARTLASGMVSGLTSPSRPWFRLELESRDLSNIPSVRMWLDEVQKRMLAVFAKSNVYGALHTVYEEVAVFGTAASFLVPDFKQVIRCRVFTIGEYYLGQNSAGVVNAFAREFWMTAGQMVEDFGIERVSDNVKAAYNRHDIDAWFKVCHLIEENDDRIEGIKDFDNMAFREVYWEAGTKNEGKFLKTGGHEEFPILAPRWSTTTTAHVYGTGPGWVALGDVRQFFHGLKMRALGIETVMKPPTQVDGNVGNLNTLPGGVSRSSSMVPNAGARPVYQINPDFNALREDITGLKQDISETFYADLFLMLNQINAGKMTAEEVRERQAEKLQILGPVLEQLENELLTPLISRTYEIMTRAGLFSDLQIPEEIAGAPLHVQYVSVLAQAQRMIGTTALQSGVAFVGQLATLDPNVIDILNLDETGKEYLDALAIPAKTLSTPEQIQAKRDARAEQQAQAQQAEQAMAMAKAGADAGGAVKDMATAPMGADSALDALLGQNQ